MNTMITNKLGQKVKFCTLIHVLKLHLHTNKMFKTTAQRAWRRMYEITEHFVPQRWRCLQLVRRGRARRVVQSAGPQHPRPHAERCAWRGGSASPSAACASWLCLGPSALREGAVGSLGGPASDPQWVSPPGPGSGVSFQLARRPLLLQTRNPPQVKLEMLARKEGALSGPFGSASPIKGRGEKSPH